MLKIALKVENPWAENLQFFWKNIWLNISTIFFQNFELFDACIIRKPTLSHSICLTAVIEIHHQIVLKAPLLTSFVNLLNAIKGRIIWEITWDFKYRDQIDTHGVSKSENSINFKLSQLFLPELWNNVN